MTKKTYAMGDVLRAKTDLGSLPEREPDAMSLREVFRLIAPELHALRRKNYSDAQIREVLRARGIEVSPSVLKKRLSEFPDPRQTKGTKRGVGNETGKDAAGRSPGSARAAHPAGAVAPGVSGETRDGSSTSSGRTTSSPDLDGSKAQPPTGREGVLAAPAPAPAPPAGTLQPQPVVGFSTPPAMVPVTAGGPRTRGGQ